MLITEVRMKLACPVLAVAAAATAFAFAAQQRPPSPTFTGLVDEYLDQFARRHPSIAAGNGLHAHDDALEDFSAEAIAAEVTWQREYRSRLDAIDPAPLSADERVDRRILLGVVDGWLLDLDAVRTWTRNPMIYASAISDGVHNLMTMESASAAQRMALATSKLGAVPRLLASARENVRTPPRVFVERGITMLHGASDLLARDLPLAFAGAGDAALQKRLSAASAAARNAIDAYAKALETEVLPRATGAYAIGTANVEARYRAEELIDVPGARLLAIGERELQKTEAEFRATAARLDPSKPPLDVWRGVLNDHRRRGGARVRSRSRVDALVAPARAASGQELLLRDRCPRRLAHRAAECLAAEVQLPGARGHFRARSGAGPLRAQPLHASHAGEDPADLDRVESVSAAFVRAGRL